MSRGLIAGATVCERRSVLSALEGDEPGRAGGFHFTLLASCGWVSRVDEHRARTGTPRFRVLRNTSSRSQNVAMKLVSFALLSAFTACTTRSSPTLESPGLTAPPAQRGATGSVADSTLGHPAAATSSDASPSALAEPSPGGSAPADDLVGQRAAEFTATAQDGSLVRLSALRGKPIVVYFYPKDETPGCTKEACSFRDVWSAIASTGAALVGISADPTASHKRFAEHYKLPFLLVSDPDGSIGRSYGVPFEGHHRRQTIVIGPDGKVRKVYRTVDVTVHAQQILDDLTHLS
ncbi:MAG: peroxiredoxin [Polyangiaceae bacterium]|jgi:peroxiredoxin Q/BCP